MHFVDVNKMVEIGNNTLREVDDIKLTKYACYLIAINGDPRKEVIALAQTYFAVKTHERISIENPLYMMYTNDSELSLSALRDCWTLEPLLSLVARAPFIIYKAVQLKRRPLQGYELNTPPIRVVSKLHYEQTA